METQYTRYQPQVFPKYEYSQVTHTHTQIPLKQIYKPHCRFYLCSRFYQLCSYFLISYSVIFPSCQTIVEIFIFSRFSFTFICFSDDKQNVLWCTFLYTRIAQSFTHYYKLWNSALNQHIMKHLWKEQRLLRKIYEGKWQILN